MDGFASHPLPRIEGKQNGQISEKEEYDVDSDLESALNGKFNRPEWGGKQRMEFEPLSDVFCFVSRFGIFMLSFAVWSHVGARFLLSFVLILFE